MTKVNNLAAGMLRLRPGFHALVRDSQRPKIPDKTAWTFLLTIGALIGTCYLFRPDLLGPALAILAAVVLIAAVAVGTVLAAARKKERHRRIAA